MVGARTGQMPVDRVEMLLEQRFHEFDRGSVSDAKVRNVSSVGSQTKLLNQKWFLLPALFRLVLCCTNFCTDFLQISPFRFELSPLVSWFAFSSRYRASARRQPGCPARR
jgi:hypothetical protein